MAEACGSIHQTSLLYSINIMSRTVLVHDLFSDIDSIYPHHASVRLVLMYYGEELAHKY